MVNNKSRWAVWMYSSNYSRHKYFNSKTVASLYKMVHEMVWCILRYKDRSIYLQYVPKYSIQINDIGLDYQDAGQWRSYSLETSGDTYAELIHNATISETDQDGGEIDCYDLNYGNAACDISEALLINFKHEHKL